MSIYASRQAVLSDKKVRPRDFGQQSYAETQINEKGEEEEEPQKINNMQLFKDHLAARYAAEAEAVAKQAEIEAVGLNLQADLDASTVTRYRFGRSLRGNHRAAVYW